MKPAYINQCMALQYCRIKIVSLKTSSVKVNFLGENYRCQHSVYKRISMCLTLLRREVSLRSAALLKLCSKECLEGQDSSTKVLQIHIGCWIIPVGGTWIAVLET